MKVTAHALNRDIRREFIKEFKRRFGHEPYSLRSKGSTIDLTGSATIALRRQGGQLRLQLKAREARPSSTGTRGGEVKRYIRSATVVLDEEEILKVLGRLLTGRFLASLRKPRKR